MNLSSIKAKVTCSSEFERTQSENKKHEDSVIKTESFDGIAEFSIVSGNVVLDLNGKDAASKTVKGNKKDENSFERHGKTSCKIEAEIADILRAFFTWGDKKPEAKTKKKK